MSIEIKHAVEMYDKARSAEEKGQLDIAELYYLKSRGMFESVGGIQPLNAAKALNSLAFLRWSRGDYEGAVCSATQAVKLMERYSAQFTSAEASFIYSTSCELIDQIEYEMSLETTQSSNEIQNHPLSC